MDVLPPKSKLMIFVSREVVASFPDQVIAMKYAASTAGQLSVAVDLVRTNQTSKGSSVTNNVGRIFLTAGNGGLNFNAQVRVVTDGGIDCSCPTAQTCSC